MTLSRRSVTLCTVCGALLVLLAAVRPLAAQGTASVTAPVTVPASPSHSILYGGLGMAETTDPTVSHAVPWTVGFIYQPAAHRYFVGLDFAGEGTSLNNTSNQSNGIDQGLSLNLIVGGSAPVGSPTQVGAGLLLGGRRVGLECPDSYLGYQCYADEAPTPSYAVNAGGLVHLTIGRLFVGVRATTESRQGLLGISF